MTHPQTNPVEAARDFALMQAAHRICDCDQEFNGHEDSCAAMDIERMRDAEPIVPIGTRILHRNPDGAGTVIGIDGVAGDLVAVQFDQPWPRGFPDGQCATDLRSMDVMVLGGDA